MALCPHCHNHELQVRVATYLYVPLNHVSMQPSFERSAAAELGRRAADVARQQAEEQGGSV